MSELRIGSIGGFILAGLIAAAGNHGMLDKSTDPFLSILTAAVLGFCLTVAFFGKRP
jgi:hypothetical protein